MHIAAEVYRRVVPRIGLSRHFELSGVIPIAFDIALVLSSIYVGWAGGRTGRFAVALWLMATVATVLTTGNDDAFDHFNAGLFATDAAFLVGLIVIASRSDRWWPMWAAAVHFPSVAAHLAAFIASDFPPKAYQAMATFSGLPVILAMTIGTALDQLHDSRLARGIGPS